MCSLLFDGIVIKICHVNKQEIRLAWGGYYAILKNQKRKYKMKVDALYFVRNDNFLWPTLGFVIAKDIFHLFIYQINKYEITMNELPYTYK